MKNCIPILLFFAANGYAQSYNTFDIDQFEKNKRVLSKMRNDAVDSTKMEIHEAYTFTKGDSLIQMEKRTDENYRIIRKRKGGTVERITIYHPNYSRFIEMTLFWGVQVGTFRKFSEAGELVEVTDYDKIRADNGFLVPILDVVKSLKKDFKMDVENESELIRWSRDEDKALKKKVYNIICPPKYPDGRPYRGFMYDAATGKFIRIFDAYPLMDG